MRDFGALRSLRFEVQVEVAPSYRPSTDGLPYDLCFQEAYVELKQMLSAFQFARCMAKKPRLLRIFLKSLGHQLLADE